jgi:hypothetical protein
VIAERLARSGAFEGASPGQLEARIWIGAALNIDPSTACSSIGFSRGKPIFSAALQASLLARHPRYDYEIVELTDEKCAISFHRDGHFRGMSTYTLLEARRAGLTDKTVWKNYPSDLLFARTLTRGIKRHAPDVLLGSAAITAEELGKDKHEPIPVKTIPTTATDKPKRGSVSDAQLADIKACRDVLAIPIDAWRTKVLARRNVTSALELTSEQAVELIGSLRTRINAKQFEEGLAQGNGDDLTADVDVVGKAKEVAAGPANKST